jgi:2-oxoisovalerate dehydrogenase E1 component
MKGLMKSAYYDPNPVVMFEHKGLYWSKVPGTDKAKTLEPDSEYMIPLGKGNIVQHAEIDSIEEGSSCLVVTYGMGVYWALEASSAFKGRVEIVDLRTLHPVDEALIEARLKVHGKALFLTEEQAQNSFMEAMAGRMTQRCFRHLDMPISVLGSVDVPAVPLNDELEKQMLPGIDRTRDQIHQLLNS